MAAWSPAVTPRRVCPSMMRAVRATTDTSASSAATRPAPTAGPCTADTIGFEQSITLSGVEGQIKLRGKWRLGFPRRTWIGPSTRLLIVFMKLYETYRSIIAGGSQTEVREKLRLLHAALDLAHHNQRGRGMRRLEAMCDSALDTYDDGGWNATYLE